MMYKPPQLPTIAPSMQRAIGYIPDDDVYISVKYEKQSKLDRLKIHKNKKKNQKIKMKQKMKQRKKKNNK